MLERRAGHFKLASTFQKLALRFCSAGSLVHLHEESTAGQTFQLLSLPLKES